MILYVKKKCGYLSIALNIWKRFNKSLRENLTKKIYITKKLYKRARESNAYIGAGYSKHTVSSKHMLDSV